MPNQAKRAEAAERTAADAPTERSPLTGTKELVELVSKGVVGFAALCFVCGILVVNLALRQFGVASFGLFRVNYVTAGVWAFSPIGFAAMLVGVLLLHYYQDQIIGEETRPEVSKLQRIVRMASAGAIAIVIVGWFLSRLGIAWDWRWVPAILVGMVVGALAVAVPLMLRFAEKPKDKVAAASAGFFCVMLFLWYLLLLAPPLYRSIPASVGGGAGVPVVLIVASDNQDVVRAAGLSFSGPLTTTRVTLLLESDKEYVVLSEGAKTATTLKADLISAVQHLSPQK